MCVLYVYVNELLLSGASTVNEVNKLQLVSHMSTDVSVGNIKQSSTTHLSTLIADWSSSFTHPRTIMLWLQVRVIFDSTAVQLLTKAIIGRVVTFPEK